MVAPPIYFEFSISIREYAKDLRQKEPFNVNLMIEAVISSVLFSGLLLLISASVFDYISKFF